MPRTKKTKTEDVKQGLNPAKFEAYESLINEIDAIRVESGYNASQTILEGKLQVGQLLVNNDEFGIKVTELVKLVAKDTKIQERELWYCYKFAERYEEIEKHPDYGTKIISWNRVKKMLADPEKAKTKCTHEHTHWIEVCIDCGAKIKHVDEQ